MVSSCRRRPVTKRVVVISDARFKNTEDSWNLKMGPIGCPETSVRNYHHSLRNNPEERSSHLLRGGSPRITEHGCSFVLQYYDHTSTPNPTNSCIFTFTYYEHLHSALDLPLSHWMMSAYVTTWGSREIIRQWRHPPPPPPPPIQLYQ